MSDKVRLHLGSGHRYLPGFINIDQDHLDHVDQVMDIKDLSAFEDESVDEIYSCGVIIYFDRYEVVDVLTEWRRVLKPGGLLRTSLADFEMMVENYLTNGKDLDAQGLLGPLFGRWEIVNEVGLNEVIYQRTAYDFSSLQKILADNGFENVERYDWREFLPEGYDDYSRAYIPHMDESGLHLALNVVCEKK